MSEILLSTEQMPVLTGENLFHSHPELPNYIMSYDSTC